MTELCPAEPCRLGYEEHDGFRYCFAHGGFVNPGTRSLLCDRRPVPTAWKPEKPGEPGT